MAKSVAKYGGFYVARYEAGNDTETYKSVKGQDVMNAGTTDSDGKRNRWYGLYKNLKGSKEETNSTMIWGCQFDQLISFVGNESQVIHTNRNLPGTNGTEDYRKSGATLLDIYKNIYDLEGNYFELTAACNGTNARLFRGGCYQYVADGNFYSAAHWALTNPISTRQYMSSRATLFL